jgi:hypothetical protein
MNQIRQRWRFVRALSVATLSLVIAQAGSAAAQSRQYVSDLSATSSTNGWGPAERDRSNGESGGGDGRTITLNGATYAKGLGVHSPSNLKYALNGTCSSFTAVVGVDDEVGGSGNLVFEVWTDGTKKYDSGVLTGSSGSQSVNVSVSGARELSLIVSNGSDGRNFADHADWADAQVTCTGASATGPREYLSDLSWTSSTNGWGPVERDRSNGENGGGDGRTITLNGATYAKGLGVHAPSTIRYALSGSCSTFSAVVGLDDEVGGSGNLNFEVWTDGSKRYDSGVLTGSSSSGTVNVNISGARELALVVTLGNDGGSFADHADWGDAQINCSSAPASSGSGVSPGQSIQAASSAAPEGATIVIKAGVHRHQSVTPKANQKFVGEDGAVMSGARQLSGFTRSGSYWVVGGQSQQGQRGGSPNDQVCRAASYRCGYPEDLFVNDVPLEHVPELGQVTAGKWFFDYDGDRIYMADDPNGKNVEASITASAFGGLASGVTISNVTIEKYATPTGGAAVQLMTGWVVEDCRVRWNHYSGVNIGADATVRRSVIHQNGAFGVFGAGENIRVQDNEISYNNFAGYNPYWGAGGTKFVETRNILISGNFSHHNGGPGLWTDINNIYVVIENNTVEDNERSGIFHELGYDAIIRYNTARRNGLERRWSFWTAGAGIEVFGAPNVEVYGNVVENNFNGITALNDNSRGSGPYGPRILRNLYVHDNTVTSRETAEGIGRSGMADYIGTEAFAAGANNRFRNNKYILGTKRNYFMWMGRELNEDEWRGYGQDATGTFQR